MKDEYHLRGGAAVGVLGRLDRWEANLILNLRLWFDGPNGKAQVWNDYARQFRNPAAQYEMQTFEALLATLVEHSIRPLVRHSVECACIGADESVFLNLVRTASDGHLNDAALIATLIAGPSQAEAIAFLAGQVGEGARQLEQITPRTHSADASNIIRLH